MAIGSGAGLTIAFTLVNDSLEGNEANQKISYLMLSFAVMPGISVAIGGILNHHLRWFSCFYAYIAYGLVLFFLTTKLNETHTSPNLKALKFKYLKQTYFTLLQNPVLVFGSLLMGGATCFIYIFTTLGPFIAIKSLGMNSNEYGIANILPAIGYVVGCLLSAQLAKNHSYKYGIRLGIIMVGISLILMAILIWFIPKNPLLTLFFPMTLISSGLPLIFSNASSFAMSNTSDKAHGSAILGFLSLSVITVSVLSLSLFPSTQHLLLIIYTLLIIGMVILYRFSIFKSY